MKEFDVTITEKLQAVVTVEAETREEAEQMVSDQWRSGDHILDADNFVDVEFEGKESVEREKEKTIDVLLVEPGQYPRLTPSETIFILSRKRSAATSKQFIPTMTR